MDVDIVEWRCDFFDEVFDEKNVMTLETLNQKIGVIMDKYKDR